MDRGMSRKKAAALCGSISGPILCEEDCDVHSAKLNGHNGLDWGLLVAGPHKPKTPSLSIGGVLGQIAHR